MHLYAAGFIPAPVERSISQRGGRSGAFRMQCPVKVTQQMRG
jgi:hypothetical protein